MIYHLCEKWNSGSETWPFKDKNEKRLDFNERTMVRWMCNANVGVKQTWEGIRSNLGLKASVKQ